MLRRNLAGLIGLLAVGAALPSGLALAQSQVQVVASFSILADMVGAVGGARVQVVTLVGADGDAHTFQPRASDAQKITAAQIVFVNGLGFEGWIERLIRASEFRGPIVTVSDGIAPLTTRAEHDEGPVGVASRRVLKPLYQSDPHAWHDLSRAHVYVDNIARALSQLDPAGAPEYRERAHRYKLQLGELDAEARRQIGAVPAAKRKVITSHDAFQYFSHAYGVEFLAPAGISTESEASAGDVARIIRQARAQGIRAVFVDNIAERGVVRQIGQELGLSIDGTLYADALSDSSGPAPTFLKLFEHNLRLLTAAMSANAS
ncbi:MAG: metal ABC transporter substrate-binding protein [Alphaproteobacteria bacterium]|nr:metal ABC transporter substrate-binding protein [Alphaproteobacteria bacterium]